MGPRSRRTGRGVRRDTWGMELLLARYAVLLSPLPFAYRTNNRLFPRADFCRSWSPHPGRDHKSVGWSLPCSTGMVPRCAQIAWFGGCLLTRNLGLAVGCALKPNHL